jgi:hypothetical protein
LAFYGVQTRSKSRQHPDQIQNPDQTKNTLSIKKEGGREEDTLSVKKKAGGREEDTLSIEKAGGRKEDTLSVKKKAGGTEENTLSLCEGYSNILFIINYHFIKPKQTETKKNKFETKQQQIRTRRTHSNIGPSKIF